MKLQPPSFTAYPENESEVIKNSEATLRWAADNLVAVRQVDYQCRALGFSHETRLLLTINVLVGIHCELSNALVESEMRRPIVIMTEGKQP